MIGRHNIYYERGANTGCTRLLNKQEESELRKVGEGEWIILAGFRMPVQNIEVPFRYFFYLTLTTRFVINNRIQPLLGGLRDWISLFFKMPPLDMLTSELFEK